MEQIQLSMVPIALSNATASLAEGSYLNSPDPMVPIHTTPSGPSANAGLCCTLRLLPSGANLTAEKRPEARSMSMGPLTNVPTHMRPCESAKSVSAVSGVSVSLKWAVRLPWGSMP